MVLKRSSFPTLAPYMLRFANPLRSSSVAGQQSVEIGASDERLLHHCLDVVRVRVDGQHDSVHSKGHVIPPDHHKPVADRRHDLHDLRGGNGARIGLPEAQ